MGCMIVLILAGIVAVALFFVVKHQYNAFLARFERDGYIRIQERYIETERSVDQPTVFMGQTVNITKGSTRGIAMFCQTADLHGHVQGNVHFIGQELTIHKDAKLKYDLNVKAQTLNIYGIVKGKITGTYVMNKKPPE